MKLTFSRVSDETFYILPLLDDTTILPNVLTGLGTLTCGRVIIRHVKDLWEFVRQSRLLATRTDALEKGTAFFSQYAAHLTNRGVELPRDLNPLNFEPDYWKSLMDAKTWHVFVINDKMTRAGLFTREGDYEYEVYDDGVWPDGYSSSQYMVCPLSIGDTLPSGAYLQPGDIMRSAGGKYLLRYQTDDYNIVIRDGNYDAKWSLPMRMTDEVRKKFPEGRLYMQPNGRLIVETKKNGDAHKYWSTHQEGNYGSFAKLGDDGILRTITPMGKETWSSNASKK